MIGSTCRCSSVQMIAAVTSGRLSNSTWLCVTKSALIFGPDFAGAVRVLLGEADPLDRRMARRHLAAEQPDAPAADDCEPDALGRFLHDAAAPAGLMPARFLSFSSAMPEIVSLVSGRSMGSLRSADKSAAL